MTLPSSSTLINSSPSSAASSMMLMATSTIEFDRIKVSSMDTKSLPAENKACFVELVLVSRNRFVGLEKLEVQYLKVGSNFDTIVVAYFNKMLICVN